MDRQRLMTVDLSFRTGRSALIRASFSIPVGKGSILAVTGPSGCGKSTLLRMLAGFLRPHSGRITFDDSLWFDHPSGVERAALNRPVGYLPQTDALFPFLTVRGNIEFSAGLIQGGKNAFLGGWFPGEERCRMADKIMEEFGILDLASSRIKNLSGGQSKRVALARLFLRTPSLLLLDEPFGGIDPEGREELVGLLSRIVAERSITTLWVTHTPEELGEIPHARGRFQTAGTGRTQEFLLTGTERTGCASPEDLLAPFSSCSHPIISQ